MTKMLYDQSDMLVRVLGHSLWQATVVAAAVWFLLRQLPARRADLRYGISVAGLVVIVVAIFATASVVQLEQPQQNSVPSQVVTVASLQASQTELFHHEQPPQELSRSHTNSTTERLADQPLAIQGVAARYLSLAWLIGACGMLLRGLWGVVTARSWAAQLKASGVFDLQGLEAVVTELCERLGLRRTVRLIVTERVATPAVIGLIWPTILIPATLLSGVPVEQWRIIIAHELAHVRRCDAIVSLAQMLIESCLFFNPAVWWLSKQVRVEREACCDALAANVCGQPLSVARTLVDVAESMIRPAPTLGLAFVEPTERSELKDRVMRLVDPDEAARPRVSWVSMTAVLAALLMTALLLQRGTDLAVRTAAQWMSPKERVEKLVQLEAETSGVFVPLADGPQLSVSELMTPGPLKKPDEARQTIPVELIVRMDDGTPVERKLQLVSLSQSGHMGSSNALESPAEAASEYRTTLYYPPCRLRIGAMHPGRTPALSPLLWLHPGDGAKSVELVLKKGSPIDAVVRDPQGRPIPKAVIRSSVNLAVAGSSSGLSTNEFDADEQGRVKLTDVGDVGYSLEIQAPGFQRHRMNTTFAGDPSPFTAEAPFVVTLTPARPAIVRVVDATTNQPVKQTRFTLVRRQSSSNQASFSFSRGRWTPNRWTDFAITDDAGVATLDQLEDEAIYTFAVHAEGYGLGAIDVRPGDLDETVKLSRPLKLAGRITGHIDRLQRTQKNERSFRQFAVYRRLGQHVSENAWAELDDDGRFSLNDMALGEQATLNIPGDRRDIVMTESITNLEIDIKAVDAPPTVPMREVVIRLIGTAEGAPARGTLYVTWAHPTVRLFDNQYGPQPLRNNEIRLNIPVGATLNFSERDLVGYQIKEQQNIMISAGTEPQVIEVPATPAGGIHGTITRADGSSAERGFVHVFATKLPASEKDHSRINPSSKSGGHKFLSRVPLGGRYRVLAYEHSDAAYVWAVSEEITLDDSHPIAKAEIQLPPGHDLKMRVLDPQGHPVVRQQINLSLGFNLTTFFGTKSTTGFSTGIETETGPDGIAVIRGLGFDQSIHPINCQLTARFIPDKFLGEELAIDPRQPIEIRLKPGLSASGVLIHAQTGEPVPNREVRIYPSDFSRVKYKDSIKTRSDAQGRFQFKALEDVEYRGHVEGAVSKGTTITAHPGGGFTFSHPNGPVELKLFPGTKEPARWEITPYSNPN